MATFDVYNKENSTERADVETLKSSLKFMCTYV